MVRVHLPPSGSERTTDRLTSRLRTTKEPRRDPPADFGRRTEHRERKPALRCRRANPTWTGSPVSFGKRTNHGPAHQPSSDDERATARSTSRLRSTNGTPGAQTGTSVQASKPNLDGFTCLPREVNEPRTGSPAVFGRRKSHGEIHQPTSVDERNIGSASGYFGASSRFQEKSTRLLR